MRAAPAALLAALLLPACRGEGTPVPDEHVVGEARPDSGGRVDPPGTLRIEPEMLRDLRITTAVVESRSAGEDVIAMGEVGVNEEAYAEVGSPIQARVARPLAAAGDRVKRGQALVELQSVELGRARAAYLSAVAREELAAHTLERKRSLAAGRIVPARELQEAEAEARAARAEHQAAVAALEAIGLPPDGRIPDGSDASLFALRSPIGGTIIARDLAMGRVVDPSAVVFRIADLSRLWLTVHAFERDALRISTGATVQVSLPALPGREMQGTVILVGRQVDTVSRTIPVRVELDNAEGLLRPGMSAVARLPVGSGAESVVSIPSASLQRMQEGWYAFVPLEDGLFEMREVGRGRDLSGEVEILSGLRPGEMVVVEGAFLLKAEAEKSRGEGGHHDH